MVPSLQIASKDGLPHSCITTAIIGVFNTVVSSKQHTVNIALNTKANLPRLAKGFGSLVVCNQTNLAKAYRWYAIGPYG